MELVRPTQDHLASYVAALERGWSADNVRGIVAAQEELVQIESDAEAFIASLEDREAKGPPIKLPDGSLRCPNSRLSPLAMGRRVRRKHQFPLAAWNRSASASLPGTCRVCGGTVEARQGICYARAATLASGGGCRRVAIYRDQHGSRECRVAARDPGEWRHSRRAIHQATTIRRQAGPEVPHCPVMKTSNPSLNADVRHAALRPRSGAPVRLFR